MENRFSSLDVHIHKFERESAQRKLSAPVSPWQDAELRPGRREKRIEAAIKSFWEFDKIYFPPEVHDTYAAPCSMHTDMLGMFNTVGVDILLAPREHAKTVYAKKMLLWFLITGRDYLVGIMCETLKPKAENWLQDISDQLTQNARLVHDFMPHVITDNSDQLEFTLPYATPICGDNKLRTIAAFGGGRSVKGYSRNMKRLTKLVIDDLETLQSSMSAESVKERGRQLGEAVGSLDTSVGSTIAMGNNHDERGIYNIMLKEQEEGVLSANWRVHVYQGWDEVKNKPLWGARFPVKTESEFRSALQVRNESDYQSNIQQNPTREDGFVFPLEYYTEYDVLPNNIRGAMYTDPNLSKKSKGDTTCALAGAWNVEDGSIYILNTNLRSYSGSNDLLRDCSIMYSQYRNYLSYFGMDGNVNQESTWTNNVRNYERISGVPFPRVVYCHYNVDVLAKNAEMFWKERLIKFPRGFSKTETGKKFLEQLRKFTSKKAGGKDDAPDALICLIELLSEKKIMRVRANNQRARVSIITSNRL